MKRTPSVADTMESKQLNRNLHEAKASKEDEFYTQLSDIEKELRHYAKFLTDKVVLCNCDDPKISNFFHYFSHNFEKLKLKKLITTCYKNQDADLFSRHTCEGGLFLEYQGEKNGNRVPTAEQIGVHRLRGDGDFRSKECVELLIQADVVVTNPPFSLFREYVDLLVKHKKQFLIIGNINAITYKSCFDLIKNDKMWLGYNCARHFRKPDGTMFESARSFWYTNLDTAKRHEAAILYKHYSPEKYPTYVNYDAIEVSRAEDIPADYAGAMGVPITFLDKYNPEQFEILGSSRTLGRPMHEIAERGTFAQGGPRFYLSNGDGTYRRMYDRLVIRHRRS
jgi:hypothetical protein